MRLELSMRESSSSVRRRAKRLFDILRMGGLLKLDPHDSASDLVLDYLERTKRLGRWKGKKR